MTLLVISPDYASHLLPLLTIAAGWREADPDGRVVVATGPATAPLVGEAGFEHVELRLGRGSNPGIIRAEQQPTGEDDNLRRFFAATREGMVATLRYQADARRNDLLWDPVRIGREVLDIVDRVRPDQVIVDHLAFGATLALRAGGVPYGDVVLGHPTALPVGDEIYGVPERWPSGFDEEMTTDAVAALRAQGAEVRDGFTATYNEAMLALSPAAEPVADAFAAHGSLVLYNYPGELHPAGRPLPPHAFLGSSVRADVADAEVDRWLQDATVGVSTGDAGSDGAAADGGVSDGAGSDGANRDRPLVYVSFGTFLSQRVDVLAKVAAALARLDVRVAMATGSADVGELCRLAGLGSLPSEWLVRPYLPQVALLDHTAVAVTHGGNNSVTEALTAGVPMLVLPFSTDQFVGAFDVERHRSGRTLAPNVATPDEIAEAVGALLGGEDRRVAAGLGRSLRERPGPTIAHEAMAGLSTTA